MPTGYTADIGSGKVADLRTFALHCARGMGALITMRDEPWDAPIPDRFEPSDYSSKRLAEAKAERDRVYSLTSEEAEAAAKAEFAEKTADKAKYRAEQAEQRGRYQAMIAQVEQWEGAPDGLKNFMLGQLHESIRFDCPEREFYWDEPVAMTGDEWRAAKLEKLEHDILYHAAEDAKERERTESRNVWIAQLRVGLADIPSGTKS